MNLTTMKNFVTSKAGRAMLMAQKQSPHILFAAGTVGIVGTAIAASKATLKVETVLDAHDERMEKIQTAIEMHIDGYDEMDARRDKALTYTKTAVDLLKLYGPTLAIGGATLLAFTQSHRILSSRNVALTAAYATIDTAFKEYRGRIKEWYGEDADKAAQRGVVVDEVIEETETGPQPKKVVRPDTEGTPSGYARVFGPYNKNWVPRPEHNVNFLRAQQNWLNDRLNAKGHLFLNEVYDALGLERSKAGQAVGWLKGGDGDNYVDFGIWADDNYDRFADFASGREQCVWLDFNVDGVIWDKF